MGQATDIMSETRRAEIQRIHHSRTKNIEGLMGDQKPFQLSPEQAGEISHKLSVLAHNAGCTDHGIGLKLLDVLIERNVVEVVNETEGL